jgi:hypothetical protein
MDKNWILIFSTTDLYKAELIKGMLNENEINAVVVNKKDSSYLFGEAEVYVMSEDVLKSRHLLKEIKEL